MGETMFTDAQLDILRKGFQEHDFTQAVSLHSSCEALPPEQAAAYADLKKQILGYMQANLPELNITRPRCNFTGDHPVNLLMDADAEYIANEAVKILDDEQQTAGAAEQFLERFRPLIEQEATRYCNAKNMDPEDASEEDLLHILDRVAAAANETMMGAVMQGQQFPEIDKIAHKVSSHEDFGEKRNPDAINFHDKWTHAKTKIGEMLSLDSPDVCIPADVDSDAEYRLLRDEFCATLDDTDTTIFYLLEDGKTRREIAAALGYQSPSTVSKRVSAMRDKFRQFLEIK